MRPAFLGRLNVLRRRKNPSTQKPDPQDLMENLRLLLLQERREATALVTRLIGAAMDAEGRLIEAVRRTENAAKNTDEHHPPTAGNVVRFEPGADQAAASLAIIIRQLSDAARQASEAVAELAPVVAEITQALRGETVSLTLSARHMVETSMIATHTLSTNLTAVASINDLSQKLQALSPAFQRLDVMGSRLEHMTNRLPEAIEHLVSALPAAMERMMKRQTHTRMVEVIENKAS